MPFVDAAAQPLGVGDEDVVADDLDLVAERLGQQCAQPSQSSSAQPSSIETIG